jgi:hypothetical protein
VKSSPSSSKMFTILGKPVLEVQATLSGALARVLASVGQILEPGDPLAVRAKRPLCT